MNKIVLSHTTALSCWRELRIDSKNSSMLNLTKDLMLSKNRKGNTSIHVMVNSQNKKHKNWRYKYHVNINALPRKSILALDGEIGIVCPELLLLQLSNSLHFLQLCLLAYEFCGTYAIEPKTKIFKNNLKPQINKLDLENYIRKYESNNKYARSVKTVKKLCNLLEDGSASPMESRLFLKLCGNRKFGLYGCKDLKFNQPIKISKDASKIAGQSVIIPDIVNKQHKVAIEYNSSLFHENSEQGQKDQRRRDALVYDGWKVHSFTPSQVYNSETFHLMSIKILNDLNQNYKIRNNNFKQNNKVAFDLLK